MKKTAIFIMFLLLVSSVAALKIFEPRVRIGSTYEYRLDLYPIEPYTGAGYAAIRSIQNLGASTSSVLIRTSNLRAAGPNEVYEAWLVDENTGYALSLGQFITGLTGSTAFATTYRGYFNVFDQLMITVEPFPDEDPTPNRVVLSGDVKNSISQIRTRPSVYSRTIGRTSERAYTGYQSQAAAQLPYRRSHSIVPY